MIRNCTVCNEQLAYVEPDEPWHDGYMLCTLCQSTFNINMIVGFDIGYTIMQLNGETPLEPYPDAIDIITRIMSFYADGGYLISRVTKEQETIALNWLYKYDFFKKTGIPVENIRWCRDYKDKGPICKQLGITHFVDDSMEVMKEMPKSIQRILFRPTFKDMIMLYEPNMEIPVVYNWKQVGMLLCNEYVGWSAAKRAELFNHTETYE